MSPFVWKHKFSCERTSKGLLCIFGNKISNFRYTTYDFIFVDLIFLDAGMLLGTGITAARERTN